MLKMLSSELESLELLELSVVQLWVCLKEPAKGKFMNVFEAAHWLLEFLDSFEVSIVVLVGADKGGVDMGFKEIP